MTRVIATGSRAEVHETGMRLARDFSGEFREMVTPADLRTFYEQLMAGVAVRDRTCMRTFAEALKLVNSNTDQVLAFLVGFGLRSPADLERVIRESRLAEGLDEDGMALRSERFLRDYYAVRGKRLVVLDQAKEATDETNGTPRGGSVGNGAGGGSDPTGGQAAR
jgi:hypothetical protein